MEIVRTFPPGVRIVGNFHEKAGQVKVVWPFQQTADCRPTGGEDATFLPKCIIAESLVPVGVLNST